MSTDEPTLRTSRPRRISRPDRLRALQPGERIFFEAPPGRLSPFMQQVQTDVGRCNLKGTVTMVHVLGITPSTREVIELVMVTRKEEPHAE
jgi:hypothetical protein